MSAGVGSAARTRRSHGRLLAGVERLGELASEPSVLRLEDPAVSEWSVGLHVEHLWKAEHGILGWIERALDDPEAFPAGGGPSRTGMAVLVSGWIPRGRAKAPERSLPDTVGDDLADRLDTLADSLETLHPRLTELHACPSTYEHPLLGHFTPAQWLRFLDVHHRHHEKIIRDIRR